MITYLLPILIGFTGGRMIHGNRGAVVGGDRHHGRGRRRDVPMFMGAMIMGPLGGWAMKKLDALWEGKIRPGFEMLVDNFSAGILGGMILAIFGFFGIGPIVSAFTRGGAGNAVDFLVENNLLPLTSILIEPAKVLFLNNAINHGVLTPLGTTQALETGKSILFLLEANPGPGLGLLLAYMVFGRGIARASAPGAAIIQFFGGIHEIYFPYVLMKPKLILATILGGMTGVFMNVLFGSGLRAPPAAPGSIIAVYAQTAGGSFLGVTLSVFGAAAVSFAVAALLLKTDKHRRSGPCRRDRRDGVAQGQEVECGFGVGGPRRRPGRPDQGDRVRLRCRHGGVVGDGSVGAAQEDSEGGLRRRHGHQRGDLQPDRQLRPRRLAPGPHRPRPAEDAVGGPRLRRGLHGQSALRRDRRTVGADQRWRRRGRDRRTCGRGVHRGADVLAVESIVLNGSARTASDAINEAGQLLVAAGAVEAAYVDAMHERERSISTYMGNGLAIPHGTNDAKDSINRTGLSFVRYAEPIDWNGKPAEFVVGIAGAGKDHMALLTKIAQVFLKGDDVARLREAQTAEEVRTILTGDDK